MNALPIHNSRQHVKENCYSSLDNGCDHHAVISTCRLKKCSCPHHFTMQSDALWLNNLQKFKNLTK